MAQRDFEHPRTVREVREPVPARETDTGSRTIVYVIGALVILGIVFLAARTMWNEPANPPPASVTTETTNPPATTTTPAPAPEAAAPAPQMTAPPAEPATPAPSADPAPAPAGTPEPAPAQ